MGRRRKRGEIMKLTFSDENGNPLANGEIRFYQPGPVTDLSQLVPAAVPSVRLNWEGSAEVKQELVHSFSIGKFDSDGNQHGYMIVRAVPGSK